ncbi:DNA-binding transcriptional LysR family regulator [Paenibacillus sp. V4I3]|uniref:LysR family transcriptional regulator n=1 Tax=Paenibacillus sp. V4I3 TaxID=3042305 RepID=UPI0027824562|nr:LysR family transcriptional regulator [Paenibacillus sp. V4I3]MDQ0877082.1 DNA-binding transcriptional LysR family regulator [Paenibacillus sp. V4I3]
MNIENIEAFVYVIHFNSFNKAADALFLSQPSVTARIQSLERKLNTLQFDREGRNFTLTEKGKQFLPYAQQILQTYKKGKQQHQNLNTTPNELRIGCTVSVSNYVIPDILPIIKKKYRNLQIKLTTAPTETILEKLLNKELDIGFVRNVTHLHVDCAGFYEDPIRLWGAVCKYELTPDEHFIIDRHPEHAHVLVAGGFSGHGFKFASVVGEILSDLSREGITEQDISPFALSRFSARTNLEAHIN